MRSFYDGDVPPSTPRRRYTLCRATAMLLFASERVRAGVAARFAIPEERTRTVEGAVDLSRFDPSRSARRIERTSSVSLPSCSSPSRRFTRFSRFSVRP